MKLIIITIIIIIDVSFNYPLLILYCSSVSSHSPQTLNEVYPEDHIYETAQVWEDPSPAPKMAVLPDSSGKQDETEEQGDLLKALYAYKGEDEDDLSFSVGDIVRVVEYCDGGWAKAFLNDQYGYVPSSYFEKCDPKDTPM